jgi:hypothetical protein
MWRTSRKKAPQARFWGRLLMNVASLGFGGWAWLFYRNIWQAAIPAFGSPEPYMAALRWLLVKYLAVGGGLLLAWWSGLILARSKPAVSVQEAGHQRQVG